MPATISRWFSRRRVKQPQAPLRSLRFWRRFQVERLEDRIVPSDVAAFKGLSGDVIQVDLRTASSGSSFDFTPVAISLQAAGEAFPSELLAPTPFSSSGTFYFMPKVGLEGSVSGVARIDNRLRSFNI